MSERKSLAERVNGLPRWARRYIHDLEARVDPAGDVQRLAELEMQCQALQKRKERTWIRNEI